MATVEWTQSTYNGEGWIFTATLGNADVTLPLKLNEGQSDVTVHAYGTIASATLVVQGSAKGTQFNTIDDAYGQAMSYTAITNVVKPVGPTLHSLRASTSGGSGTSVTVDVLIRSKVRPG